MRPHGMIGAAVLVLALAPAARALTVTVPGDYATIGAAIASGADVIKVDDGTYHENLSINRSLELRAADPVTPSRWPAFPTIGGTMTFPSSGTGLGTISVIGFRVTGLVTLATPYGRQVLLRECRLEQGVTSNGLLCGGISLRGCTVLGNVNVNPEYVEVTCSTLLEAGVTANYEADGILRYNYVVGPADVGLKLFANDGGGMISDNVVTGTTDGIVVADGAGAIVTRNEVHAAGRHAYRMTKELAGPAMPNTHFSLNYAFQPAGDGFNVLGAADLDANTVMGPGGYGIYATSTGAVVTGATLTGNNISQPGQDGIRLEGDASFALECSQNSVTYAGGHGIWLAAAGPVQYNLVGRCSGAGLVIAAPWGSSVWRNNTSFLNGSHGFTLGGDAGTSILNNISYGNHGYGLRWTGTGTPTRGCNDWFANVAGTVYGTTPGATDLFVNPLFCDLPHNVVYLSTTSPLVGTTCGQIGAKGIACSEPVGVSPEPAAALGFSAGARPAAGTVRFSWRALEQPGVLEVFDAVGARVLRRPVAAGETGVEWTPAGSSGSTDAPGIYFARLRSGGREERQRVVLLH